MNKLMIEVFIFFCYNKRIVNINTEKAGIT